MARFIAAVSAAAPLQIQLGARIISGDSQVDVTAPLIVTEVSAFGDATTNNPAQLSRPVFLRPTTPGYVTDLKMVQRGQPLGNPGSLNAPIVSAAGWLGTFSVPPSTPTVVSGNFNPPNLFRYQMPIEHGIVVTDFFVLYAQALQGASWRAHVIWEEK
jgi:hypothetical protein